MITPRRWWYRCDVLGHTFNQIGIGVCCWCGADSGFVNERGERYVETPEFKRMVDEMAAAISQDCPWWEQENTP